MGQCNIQLSGSGKLTISPAFRAELGAEGWTDKEIDAGLMKKASYMTNARPETWPGHIRVGCQWARDDAAKAPTAAAGSRKPFTRGSGKRSF